MIVSGAPHDLSRPNASLAILDVGFARRRRSCGLLLPNGVAQCVSFGEARSLLTGLLAASAAPLNLVIEAPLSVAFSSDGNPTGRTIESRDGHSRYWYVGLGTSVMVAALYLIRALATTRSAFPVLLFEGFVSFKPAASNHLADVAALRQVISNPRTYTTHIVAPEALRAEPTDTVASAGQLCGIDFGIPYVISDRRLTPACSGLP